MRLWCRTCALDDVRADAVAARAVILQALDALVGRWLAAIEGEHDETRVHYLMSDVAHDVLRELGESVQAAPTRLPMLGERIARGAKPHVLTMHGILEPKYFEGAAGPFKRWLFRRVLNRVTVFHAVGQDMLDHFKSEIPQLASGASRAPRVR